MLAAAVEAAALDCPPQQLDRASVLNAPAGRKLTSALRLGEHLCLFLDDIGAVCLVAHEDDLFTRASATQLGNAVGGKELEDRPSVKDVHYSAPPISADSSSEVSRSPVSLGRGADTAGASTGMIPSSARAAFVAEASGSPLSLAIVEEATLPWR